ncbi:MAG: serine/threonine protein kinase [Anaerolineae bacterium]|nr:MAG: serine/threonine protein kinase [Anaerolineae bacterium]
MSYELACGTVLRERYEIQALIGRGGMGGVYESHDRRLPGRRCAVKEIHLPADIGPAAAAQAREQFQQEARTLARLDHPNLPKVSDYFSVGDRDYLVMDYVPGRDLHQIVQETARQGQFLDEAQVAGWARQICDALAYLHRQDPPVVHRDLKPANLKLTPDGQVKVVDFGLVKPVDPDDPRTLTSVRGLGSLPYLPLEQYADVEGHTDSRSDLYALGATLYHLLTGQAPPSAQQRFLQPESLPLPRQINPDLSAEAESAILAAMAIHPSRRPPSVGAWRRLWLSPEMPVAPAARPLPAWAQVLWANAWLLALATALTALSVYLSLR